MAKKDQLLDMSPLGMLFTVLQTAEETAGRSLDLHWDLLPGCNMKDPLLHIHPNAIETYEILEGKMEFFIKDKWVEARRGDKLEVAKGVTHSFRNPTDKIVKVFNTHQPALKMENYFEDVVSVLNKLTNNRTAPFKMNFRAKMYLSVLMGHYRNDIISKSPPDLALRILGFVGNTLGMKY